MARRRGVGRRAAARGRLVCAPLRRVCRFSPRALLEVTDTVLERSIRVRRSRGVGVFGDNRALFVVWSRWETRTWSTC
eukprot:5481701-Prymnesium_polylepis.1